MARAFRILTWILIAGTALAIVNGDPFGIVLGAACLAICASALRYLHIKRADR